MNIVLPSLGDIEEVEVTEICVAVGDAVGAEDPIIVIESDKASMEVPAGDAGTIVELNIALGDQLGEGAVIGRLEVPGTQSTDAPVAAAQPSQPLPSCCAPSPLSTLPPSLRSSRDPSGTSSS